MIHFKEIKYVSCGKCSHYVPDPIGVDGIGTCTLYIEHLKKHPKAPTLKPSLYPRVLRECKKFELM